MCIRDSRYVISHGVHVAAGPAEIVLPVYEEKGRLPGVYIAVVRPLIRVSGDCISHGCTPQHLRQVRNAQTCLRLNLCCVIMPEKLVGAAGYAFQQEADTL